MRKTSFYFAMVAFTLFSACNRTTGDQIPELILLDALFPPEYNVGGVVTGLAGTVPLQLLDNKTDSITEVTGDGIPQDYEFQLTAKYRTLDQYNVSIQTYPDTPLQVCQASGTVGEVVNNDRSTIQVDCITAYRLYLGSISGLLGEGLVLENRGVNFGNGYTDPYNIELSMNGSAADTYYFSEPLGVGGDYNVSVTTQPKYPWQTCSLGGISSGSSVSANVTLPSLACVTDQFTLTATASNLQYSGLEITLATNGGAPGTPIALTSGSPSHSFGLYDSGTDHSVAISSQPIGQTCSVSGSPDTIHGGSIDVKLLCEDPTGYPVSGTILAADPLKGSGFALELTITHLDLSTSTSTIYPDPNVAGSDSNYVFPAALNYGEDYSVRMATQPTGIVQDCKFNVGGGQTFISGSSINGAISLPDISCITRTYTLSGTITGLSSSGAPALAEVVGNLNINGLTVETTPAYNSGSGTFNFAFGSYESGSTYSLVPSHHQGLKCVASGGSNGDGTGTIDSSNITNLVMDCDVRYAYVSDYYYSGFSNYSVKYGSLNDSTSQGTLFSSSTQGIADLVNFPDGSDWIYTSGSRTDLKNNAGFTAGSSNCSPATYMPGDWIAYTCYKQYGGITDWNYEIYSQSADGTTELKVTDDITVNSRYTTLIPGTPQRLAWVETTEPANDTPFIKACDFNTVTGQCASAAAILLNSDLNRTGIMGLTTSPDGTKMLLTMSYSTLAAGWHIFEWNIGNPTATPGAGLTQLASGYDPAYHPNGQSFLFNRSDPDISLYHYDLGTGTETRLIQGNSYYDYRDPAFYFKPD